MGNTYAKAKITVIIAGRTLPLHKSSVFQYENSLRITYLYFSCHVTYAS